MKQSDLQVWCAKLRDINGTYEVRNMVVELYVGAVSPDKFDDVLFSSLRVFKIFDILIVDAHSISNFLGTYHVVLHAIERWCACIAILTNTNN